MPNISISRRLDSTVQQFSLPAAGERSRLDSLTAEVLLEGVWAAHAMTTPLRMSKERLHRLADDLAYQVMRQLHLRQVPEVAVRNCRGLCSADKTKRSILVKIVHEGKSRTYALLSCAGAVDYSLLLVKGSADVSKAVAQFLWEFFRCQVRPLPLSPQNLSLFLSFWVCILGSSSPSEQHVSLTLKHPTLDTCELELTTTLSKAKGCMQRLGIGKEIFEEDSDNLIDALYGQFGKVMPLEFDAFFLESIHLAMASLQCSGLVHFHDCETASDVVRYLVMLARDISA